MVETSELNNYSQNSLSNIGTDPIVSSIGSINRDSSGYITVGNNSECMFSYTYDLNNYLNCSSIKLDYVISDVSGLMSTRYNGRIVIEVTIKYTDGKNQIYRILPYLETETSGQLSSVEIPIKKENIEQVKLKLKYNSDTTSTVLFKAANLFNSRTAAEVAIDTYKTVIISGDKGYITELTVDKIDTSNKIERYKNSDTSRLGYWEGQDQHIDFIEEVIIEPIETEQATARTGELLYWEDQFMHVIDIKVTPYPVLQYKYDKYVKMSLFHYIDSVTGYANPKIVFGAGTGNDSYPDRAKAFLYKTDDEFILEYMTTFDQLNSIKIGEYGINIGGQVIKLNGKDYSSDQMVRVWVAESFPPEATENDLLVDTNDWRRYLKKSVTSNEVGLINQPEFIEFTGSTSLNYTLPTTGTTEGCISKLKNSSTAIINLIGTIDGITTNILYPKESVELAYNGTDWRIM